MPDALSVVLRAASFVLLFQAAGIALFVALFGTQLETSLEPIRRAGRIAALAAMACVAAHYALQAARMAGELAGIADPAMQAIVWHSASRGALLVRLAGLTLIAVGLRRGGASSAFLGAGALLSVLAFTLTGHTTTSAHRGVLAALLVVHLSIVAFWFGALAPLYLASARETPANASRIVQRFTLLATWLVPLILVAGTAIAVLLIPSTLVLHEPYGKLLLTKVIGFAALLALGAANKWRLGPALAAGSAPAARRFRRSVAAEYVLLAAVLTVTAVMTTFFSPELPSP